jgi:hypothetical protein
MGLERPWVLALLLWLFVLTIVLQNGSYGSNSRARADRGYDLGWKPAKGTQEMLDGIADEVQAVIADGKQ